jgi:hypothetical protein
MRYFAVKGSDVCIWKKINDEERKQLRKEGKDTPYELLLLHLRDMHQSEIIGMNELEKERFLKKKASKLLNMLR